MPNSKIHFTRIFYEGTDPTMFCDFCDYNTTSKTGLRLHLKVKHAIHHYDFDRKISKICRGCKKEFKKCIRQK